MIEAPKEDKTRAGTRAVVEALAQITPVTSALSTLYGFTHPSQFEQAIEAWRDEVSAAVNDHEARLDALEKRLRPRLVISETGLQIAIWIAKQSPKGLQASVGYKDIASNFSAIPSSDLQKALFELQHRGLITINGAIGHPVYLVTPSWPLFIALDRAAVGNDPTQDAVQIAQAILSDQKLSSASKLKDALGWSLRQLNPALHLIVDLLPPGRVSQERQPDFVTPYFVFGPQEQFLLEEFIRTHSANNKGG